MPHGEPSGTDPHETSRRGQVLDSALSTFARQGYRKTSMDDVASEAGISRPGLYFLFSSKVGLFRETVERAVSQDLAAATRSLAEPGRGLADRVVTSFDHWAGRYVGPLGDVPALIESSPELLGPVVASAPAAFAAALRRALADEPAVRDPGAVARTLISVSIGIKCQTSERRRYLEEMRGAADLLLPGPGRDR